MHHVMRKHQGAYSNALFSLKCYAANLMDDDELEKPDSAMQDYRRLLYEIVQFYRAYPIVHTLRAELSWSQYGVLMRIEDARERAFYEDMVENIAAWRAGAPVRVLA